MPTGVKPDIPIGTMKLTAFGRYGPTIWNNVFYGAIGTFDPAHLDDANELGADAIGDLYATAFAMANFPASWHLDGVRVVFHDAADSHYRTTKIYSAVGIGGASQDAQVAYLIDWTTNDPRKGGKPRTYVPGVLDAAMADVAALDPGLVAGITGRIATWLAHWLTASSGTASDFQLLGMSFVLDKAYRDVAHGYPVRAGHLNSIVATQRRRVDRLR